MAIVFPASPSTNDTFTAGSITYKWDGAKWIGLGVTPADRLVEGSNSLEITAGNDLVWTGDNIGINDTSPDNKLHITTTSSSAYSTNTTNTSNLTNALLKLQNLDGGDGTGVNNYVGIQFSVASGATSVAQLQYVRTGDNSGKFEFKARNTSSSYPNIMTLLSDGDVGIGTDSPTSDGGTTLEIYNDTTPTLKLNDGGDYQALFQLRGNDLEIRGSNGVMEFYTGAADGASSSERFRIKSNGDLKHTGLRIGGGDNKLAILVTPSHNTNEEDVIVYQVENESSFNQITFGGGTSSYNAATKLSFKTASAVDTTGGTERLSIDSNGIVRSHQTGIGGSSLTLDLGSNQVVAGFQAKEMSGAAQALTGYWFNHGGLNAGIASTRQVTNQWGTDLRFYTHPFATSDQHKVYERFRIDPDGRIFIRDLLGNASAGSTVKYSNSDDELRYDTSSGLLKTNITECPYGIETVKKLKPSRYTPQEYDKEGNINITDEVLIGFIAEEMVEEVPEVVQMYPKSTLTRNDEDTEIVPAAISYDKLTAVLTKALQEAIAEIETLRGRLDAAGL